MATTCWIYLSLLYILAYRQGKFCSNILIIIFYSPLFQCVTTISDQPMAMQPGQCTSGFATREQLNQHGEGVFQSYFNDIRLIPDMKFTCRGTIVRVIMVGVLKQNITGKRLQLTIWRKNETEPEIYHRSKLRIVLPSMCKGKMLQTNMMFKDLGTIYQCQLQMSMRISVKPGDVLGIELPPKPTAKFELLYFNESGLKSYTFERDSSSTFDVSNSIGNDTVQPLISITINPGIPVPKYTPPADNDSVCIIIITRPETNYHTVTIIAHYNSWIQR